MKKKTIVIIIVAVLAVALVLTLGIAIGRGAGGAQDGPQSTETPYSITLPESTVIPHNPQSKPTTDDSIPYVGPIDSPIIGKWEDHPDYDGMYGMFFEFLSDGTLNTTQFYADDADYPENWWYKTYNFNFDIWRGIEVLESGYFKGYMHHRVEFYELDGRAAMDIITIMDDGEEYVSLTLLKIEE